MKSLTGVSKKLFKAMTSPSRTETSSSSSANAVLNLTVPRTFSHLLAGSAILRFSVVRTFAITWLNGHYWDRCTDSNESPEFNEYACLRSVCWLEVSGYLPQVLPKGYYYLVFRIKITSGLNFKAEWSVQQNGQTLLSYRNTPDTADLKTIVNKGWTYFNVGLFHVTNDRDPIFVRIFGENPYWCSGLNLDGAYVCKAEVPWAAVKPLHLARKTPSKSTLRPLPLDTVKIVQSFLMASPN